MKGQVRAGESCLERLDQSRKVMLAEVRSDQEGHAMKGQVKAERSCQRRSVQIRKVMSREVSSNHNCQKK